MSRVIYGIYLFLAAIVLCFSSCTKSPEYSQRRPEPEELAGNWVSSGKVPGMTASEMRLTINRDNSCEFTGIPVYDQETRNYRVFSGRGQWLIHSALSRQARYAVLVAPDDTNLSASLEILITTDNITLRYSTDPEVPNRAIFSKLK